MIVDLLTHVLELARVHAEPLVALVKAGPPRW